MHILSAQPNFNRHSLQQASHHSHNAQINYNVQIINYLPYASKEIHYYLIKTLYKEKGLQKNDNTQYRPLLPGSQHKPSKRHFNLPHERIEVSSAVLSWRHNLPLQGKIPINHIYNNLLTGHNIANQQC